MQLKKCPNILKKVNVIKLVENNIFFVADWFTKKINNYFNKKRTLLQQELYFCGNEKNE
jgi:hypothetical protein